MASQQRTLSGRELSHWYRKQEIKAEENFYSSSCSHDDSERGDGDKTNKGQEEEKSSCMEYGMPTTAVRKALHISEDLFPRSDGKNWEKDIDTPPLIFYTNQWEYTGNKGYLRRQNGSRYYNPCVMLKQMVSNCFHNGELSFHRFLGGSCMEPVDHRHNNRRNAKGSSTYGCVRKKSFEQLILRLQRDMETTKAELNERARDDPDGQSYNESPSRKEIKQATHFDTQCRDSLFTNTYGSMSLLRMRRCNSTFDAANLSYVRPVTTLKSRPLNKRAYLAIGIHKVVFQSHPLQIKEEQIFNQMRQLYACYKQQQSRLREGGCLENIEMLINRTKSPRRSMSQSRENKILSPAKDMSDIKTELTELLKQIRHFLVLLLRNQQKIQDSESLLLKMWKQLEHEREKQGFCCTEAALCVRPKNETDKKDVSRTKQLHGVSANLEVLARWLREITMDTGKSRIKIIPKFLEEVEEFEDFAGKLKDLRYERRVWFSFKKIPENTGNNNAESKRRRVISSEKYSAKLLVNGKVVCETPAVKLEWPHYCLRFNRTFVSMPFGKPKNVCVEIRKEKLFSLVPEPPSYLIKVQIPGIANGSNSSVADDDASPFVTWYQFNSDESRDAIDRDDLRCRGSALISSLWSVSANQSAYCHFSDSCMISSERQGMQIPRRTDYLEKSQIIKAEKITSSRDEAECLDETDQHQKNIQTTSDVKVKCHDQIHEDTRGNVEDPATIQRDCLMAFKLSGTRSFFTNQHNLEEPQRHFLIKMRNSRPLQNKQLSIPLREDYLKNDAGYNKIIINQRNQFGNEKEEHASHERSVVAKDKIGDFVKRVRDSANIKQKNILRRPLSWTEIVKDISLLRFNQESDVPDILQLFLPSRKRALFPTVERRLPSLYHTKDCRLLVTVMEAKNAPSRTPNSIQRARTSVVISSPSKKTASDERINPEEIDTRNEIGEKLKPFVQIQFQGKLSRTRPSSGISPIWKQTLDISLDQKLGVSPQSLTQVRDFVEIILFDSVDGDVSMRGGFYDDEDTSVKEMRYIGHVLVPFSTIYREGNIEGTFRVNVPETLFGYTKGRNDNGDFTTDDGLLSLDRRTEVDDEESSEESTLQHKMKMSNNLQLSRVDTPKTYIKLFMTLEPLLCAPNREPRVIQSKENNLLVKYAKLWMEHLSKLSQACSKREFDILVPDINGYTWLVTRFLRSQAPPQDLDSVYKCAHFVSLIPSLNYWQAFSCDLDIWCTSQQFLDILAGDREEHAVLLANYFMFLSREYPEKWGAEVFVVIGTGIPEGKTAYVMRKSSNVGDMVFWDATNGSTYTCDDENCPLQNISCVVSCKNIYANIQQEGKPCQINFDFDNPSLWKAFYSEKFPPPSPQLPSIQEPMLIYTKPNKQFAAELQEELVDMLKNSLRGWRRGPTSFRGDVSNRLYGILEQLEGARLNGKSVSLDDSISRVESVTKGKVVFGMPLHFPFTDVKDVVRRVELTAIHECKHPDVEFALGVRVFTYVCNVVSVWVFICTLSPDTFVILSP